MKLFAFFFRTASAIAALAGFILAQNITFTGLPRTCQLYGRDAQDSAAIRVAGFVSVPGRDSVVVALFKAGALSKRKVKHLSYVNGSAAFADTVKIHAELSEYAVRVYLNDSLVSLRDSLLCGDVFIADGQSNTLTNWPNFNPGAAYGFRSEWIRSFGAANPDGPNCGACLDDTAFGVAHAIGANGNHLLIGTWEMRVAEQIVGSQGIPVIIINGAVGNTAIEEHLRSTNTGTIYGNLYNRISKAGLLQSVKTFLWYQGEAYNWPGDGSYNPTYIFDQIRDAWKSDCPGIQRFYVFQVRPHTGPFYNDAMLREKQRRLPSLLPDVSVLSTNGVGGYDGLHFNLAGYLELGDRLYPVMARDLYGAQGGANIDAPDIRTALLYHAAKSRLVLTFNQPISFPADTLGKKMKDYFYYNATYCYCSINPCRADSMAVDTAAKSVTLFLPAQVADSMAPGSCITYLPPSYYPEEPTRVFEGPWLRNPRGIGALSFTQFPVNPDNGTGVEDAVDLRALRLDPPRPNPFNPGTRITWSSPLPAKAEYRIYDMAGRIIRVLQAKGNGVSWDGNTGAGIPAASGCYAGVLFAGRAGVATQSLMLMR